MVANMKLDNIGNEEPIFPFIIEEKTFSSDKLWNSFFNFVKYAFYWRMNAIECYSTFF